MDITNYVSNIYFLEYLYKYYPKIWIKFLTLNKNTFDVAISILIRRKYTNAKYDIMSAIQFLSGRNYTNVNHDIYSDEYEQIINDDNSILYRIIDYDDSEIITLILISENEGFKILSYVIDPNRDYIANIINAINSIEYDVTSFSPAQMIYILQHSRVTPNDYTEILGYMLHYLPSNDDITYTQFTNFLIDNAGPSNYTQFILTELQAHYGLNLEKLVQKDTSNKNYTTDILNKLKINYDYDQLKYIIDQDQGDKDYGELIENIIAYNYWSIFNPVHYINDVPIRVYKIPPEEFFRVLELVLMNSTANNYDVEINNLQNENNFFNTEDKERIINLLGQYST